MPTTHEMVQLDAIDRAILRQLQVDARLSNVEHRAAGTQIHQRSCMRTAIRSDHGTDQIDPRPRPATHDQPTHLGRVAQVQMGKRNIGHLVDCRPEGIDAFAREHPHDKTLSFTHKQNLAILGRRRNDDALAFADTDGSNIKCSMVPKRA